MITYLTYSAILRTSGREGNLNVALQTVILPKTIPKTQQGIFDVSHGFINVTQQLTELRDEVSFDSF